jgi:outer membrane murein-binding lipoprotein Lpp
MVKLPSLYELTNEWAELAERLERADEEGLSDDAAKEGFAAWFAKLDGTSEAKFDQLGKFVRMLDLDAKAAHDEAERLRKRAQASEKKAARVKQSMLDMMAVAGLKTMRTPSFTFSRCANGGKQPIVLADVDPNEIAALFPHLVVMKAEINKEAVRGALDAGDSLPFAQLAPRGEHIKIR